MGLIFDKIVQTNWNGTNWNGKILCVENDFLPPTSMHVLYKLLKHVFTVCNSMTLMPCQNKYSVHMYTKYTLLGCTSFHKVT